MDPYAFLTELASNPYKQLEFALDPARAMAAAGLDPRSHADIEGLSRAVACGDWSRAEAFFDPNHDPVPPDDEVSASSSSDGAGSKQEA